MSASVRTRLAAGVSSNASYGTWTYRVREKTNVTITNPRTDWWNGYVSVASTPQEKGTGNIVVLRMALLTGISGTALNQSGATLTQLSYFKAAAGTPGYLYKLDGSQATAAEFVTANGALSVDGYSITVPNGWIVSSDEAVGLSISAGTSYFIQTETQVTGTESWPFGAVGGVGSTLGDEYFFEVSGAGTKVFAKNWTGANHATSSASAPIAVWGTGPRGTKVAAVSGDSIFRDSQDSVAGATAITGDANGCVGFANRALNAGGYSWVRTAIGSSSAGTAYSQGGYAIRNLMLRYSSAVITDMGTNDQNKPWAGAVGTGYLATLRWYWATQRAALKGGTGRVISTDLLPQSTSSDLFATTANQTSTCGPGTTAYDSVNPFFAAGVFDTSLGDPDAAYLANVALYAGAVAAGFTDVDAGHIKWPANGSGAPSSATPDGIHGKGAVYTYIAADLAPRLPTLFGF